MPILEEEIKESVEMNRPGGLLYVSIGIAAIRNAISHKPKGHDFDYSRQRADGQVARHMSHTGG